jgi:hypothetical protein
MGLTSNFLGHAELRFEEPKMMFSHGFYVYPGATDGNNLSLLQYPFIVTYGLCRGDEYLPNTVTSLACIDHVSKKLMKRFTENNPWISTLYLNSS